MPARLAPFRGRGLGSPLGCPAAKGCGWCRAASVGTRGLLGRCCDNPSRAAAFAARVEEATAIWGTSISRDYEGGRLLPLTDLSRAP
jgi:hypothetical protein